MSIAFLGLGKMGSGICSRLLGAGREVIVWNRTAEKAAPLLKQGARWANTASEAVSAADVVMTSLMDDNSESDLFAAMKPGLKPGTVHVSLSTISPACADQLAAGHQSVGSLFVSGPVLGRPDAAQAGKLIQFLAGPAEAIARVEPLSQAFAQRVVVLPGPPSVANKQKLCMNFFIIALIECMAEGLTFAEKIGASPEVLAAFYDTALAHPGLKQYAHKLAVRDTDGEGGFALSAGYKDVSLMLAEAKLADCPLELAEVIASKMQAALAQGRANQDWAAIQEIGRQRAGLAASAKTSS